MKASPFGVDSYRGWDDQAITGRFGEATIKILF
jgi:hypothetical protein